MPLCANCGLVLDREAAVCTCGSETIVCCRTCGYWLPREGAAGYCHRTAPSFGPDGAAVWPRSLAWDWCGQYGSLPIVLLSGSSTNQIADYLGELPGRAPAL